MGAHRITRGTIQNLLRRFTSENGFPTYKYLPTPLAVVTVMATALADYATLMMMMMMAGNRLFPGVGDAQRKHCGAERLQVHLSECLQRRHHVCRWRACLTAGRRPTRLRLPYHRPLRRLQHHDNCRTRLRTQGVYVCDV